MVKKSAATRAIFFGGGNAMQCGTQTFPQKIHNSYISEPINIFNCSKRIVNTYEPIRLSYHRMCHYNSISNPSKPSVGVGLGLPNYHPTDTDRRRLHDAVRASEQLLIEQVKTVL